MWGGGEGGALWEPQHPGVSHQLQPASSPQLLLPQAWGLTPLGLERINFVLTPLEAGLQADSCLLAEGGRQGRAVLKMERQKSDHRVRIDTTQVAI